MATAYLKRFAERRLRRFVEHFACVVVTGARQIGKSTLLQHTFPEYDCVVFDPIIEIENSRRDPELFLRNHPAPLILDEIQYVPELVPVLKRLIDKDKRPGRYILTGSQQWGVIKGLSESLAGRAVFLDLHSLSLAEISQQESSQGWLSRLLDQPEVFLSTPQRRVTSEITLFEQLWRGFLPEAQVLPIDLVRDFQSSYQRTYIERDIRLLAGLKEMHLFSRFVGLCAALTAQEVNYSQLGREIGVSPNTARDWLHLLRSTFQWFEIQAFSQNLVKGVSGKSKGYVADTGQICFSQALSTPTTIGGHPLSGALFETAVVNEVVKQCGLMDSPPNLFHWRRHSGPECDLVLERDGQYLPIEIKLRSRPTRQAARGLAAFRKHHPSLKAPRGVVIAPSESVYPISDHDWVIPWDLV